MFSLVLSAAVQGIEAYLVKVESHLESGLLAFTTVGLPEGAVRESKERVTAAIKNSGYPFPQKRITINLAPADVRKEGSAFDCAYSYRNSCFHGTHPNKRNKEIYHSW